MAALVLKEGGMDPTVVIGGRLKNIKSSARLGLGDYLVAEADESDASFLKLYPTLAVVTNIDDDHLNFYGSMENLKNAFIEFVNRIPFYGASFLCGEDDNIREIKSLIKRKTYTYAMTGPADFKAECVRYRDFGSEYQVYFSGKRAGNIRLNVPGRHNLLNSLAACAAGMELEIPFKKIREGLESFRGVDRRLEIKAQLKNVIFIDDYGHHPTEIRTTLKTIRETWPARRVICLFQPHRFSRTKDLAWQFGKAFSSVDYLILLPIYPAGEKAIPGVTSLLIWENLPRQLRKTYVEDRKKLIRLVLSELKPGDILLTQGAGDISRLGEDLIGEFRKK